MLPSSTLREGIMIARRVLDVCRRDAEGCIGAEIPIAVSIGVAQWTRDIGVFPDRLIAAADQALYAAKNEGKNRYAAHDHPRRRRRWRRAEGAARRKRRRPPSCAITPERVQVDDPSRASSLAGRHAWGAPDHDRSACLRRPSRPPSLCPPRRANAELAALAKQSGTPDIPGLKIVWLAPWGDVAKAHPWKNIIVHQTEGPAGSARGGASEQNKNPTRRGVMVWVETDGTVYWAVGDHLVPTHTDGADRNDNKYIDNSKTFHQVNKDTSIGVEFAGNYPDVTRPATQAQIDAWRILVKVLRARYDIPLDRVYAHNWIDFKDKRYCEGCALATLAREWGRPVMRARLRPVNLDRFEAFKPSNEKSRRCRRLFARVSIRQSAVTPLHRSRARLRVRPLPALRSRP